MSRLALLGATVLLALPGTASAAAFRDRVLTSTPAKARAAQSTGRAYAIEDGGSVRVAFASGVAEDTALAQSYVAFLDSLPHGDELGELSLLIATPEQVVSSCGGVEGTLACYTDSTHLAIVPTSGLDSTSYGVSTAYVLAHEYGHHIAAYRSNAPFAALDYGPKRWASYERVCTNVLAGRLVPGDEGDAYAANPGEAWADTYAHLTFPDVDWQFTDLLRPDDGAFAAAEQDVAAPWTGNVTRTFRRVVSASSPTRRLSFTLHLDGALKVTLTGPRTSRLRVSLRSLGTDQGSAATTAGRAVLRYAAACRDAAAERVTATITRLGGRGPVTLRVTYAG